MDSGLSQAKVEKMAGRFLRSERQKENLYGHVFLMPWLLGLLLLTSGPIIASFYLSFTQYDLLTPPNWIGLDNYTRLFDDDRFFSSLRVTFTFVFLSVPLKLVFALAIALVLNRGLRAIGLYRAVYYVPSLLGGSVAIALLWRRMFGRNGLTNQVLERLWFEDLPSWIATPQYALYPLVVLAVWQFGSPMLIFLAGLKQIPSDLYEAAQIDGANSVQRFFQITLPLLTPVLFFNLVLQMIAAFQSFTPAFIISGGSGGPRDSTLFYTLYLYQQGFVNLQMGLASAMAWILLLIIAAFTALNFVSSRYWVYYQDER
jgi:multiple sugar transport system permease protein